MRGKGFTLIELLAVILILGIIALIAIPTISKIIDDAKKGAFETTVNNLEKKVVDTCSMQQLKGTSYIKNYNITNGEIEPSIDIKGELPDGSIEVDNKCGITYSLSNKIYMVDKNTTNSEKIISKCNGTCKLKYVEASLNGAFPRLDAGMIPITIENNGNVKKADLYSEWYKYNDNDSVNDNSRWANAVLVTNSSRKNYQNADANTIINPADIRAYLVWIPRFKYAIPTVTDRSNPPLINIQFENKNKNKSLGDGTGTNYYTHPAFTFDGIELNGIWVGKFETTVDSNSTCGTCSNDADCKTKCENIEFDNLSILPNIKSLRNQNIKTQFETAKKLENYGIESNSHMMKNSEWAAVTYLTHSIYGINNEVRINNNSNFITGCGASSVNAGETTTCSIPYGSNVSIYPQSTTGNITGIFDMSGGSWEYVMGNYNSELKNSGFNKLPESKYFDLYTNGAYEIGCNGGPCKGHANYEVYAWYNDYYYGVDLSGPWYERGGGYSVTADAGLYNNSRNTGDAYNTLSFRITCTN